MVKDGNGLFLEGVIADWLPIIEQVLVRDGCPAECVEALATLMVCSRAPCDMLFS